MGDNCENFETGIKEPDCLRRLRKLESRAERQDQINEQLQQGLKDNREIISSVNAMAQIQAGMQENIKFISDGVLEIKDTMKTKADKDDLIKIENDVRVKANSVDLKEIVNEVGEIKDAPIIDRRAIKVGLLSGGGVVFIGAVIEILLTLFGAK